MNFVFPTPSAEALETITVPKDVAIVAFHQATNAGMYLAKESYIASFESPSYTDKISVLILAKWIRAYYESK